MKWIFSIFLILGFFAGIASAQDCPDTLWTKVYDLPQGTGALEAHDQVLLEDGGVLLCGSIGYAPAAQIWIARTNNHGDTLWTRAYGEPGLHESCLSVCKCHDGNYILSGYRGRGRGYGHPGDSSIVYVLKINSNGDTLWTRTYGRPGSMMGRKIVETQDGGFSVAGSTNYWEDFFVLRTPGADSSDMFLLRLDENGDSLWFHTYGGSLGDEAFSMLQTYNGGYVLAGATGSFGDTLGDVYLVRTDSAGNELWSQTYGNPGITDYVLAMDAKNDRGFLLTGESWINPGSAAYVICVDSSGNLQWNNNYRHGLSSVARSVETLSGDSFTVAISSLVNIGSVNPYVIWGTPQGNIYRACDYALPWGIFEVYPLSIQVTPDACYSICGFIGDEMNAAFLLRTEPDPLLIADVRIPLPFDFKLSVFPNPFNATTTISFNLPKTGEVRFAVYDVLGRVVNGSMGDHMGSPLQAGEHHVVFDGAGLASGVYFVKIESGTTVDTRKILLLK